MQHTEWTIQAKDLASRAKDLHSSPIKLWLDPLEMSPLERRKHQLWRIQWRALWRMRRMCVVVHYAFSKGQCLLVLCRSELHKIVPCSAHLGSWGGAQCVEKRQAGHYGGKGGAGTFSGGRHGLEHCARKARGIFLKECPKISMYCHCIEIRRVMRVCSREENQGKTTQESKTILTSQS